MYTTEKELKAAIEQDINGVLYPLWLETSNEKRPSAKRKTSARAKTPGKKRTGKKFTAKTRGAKLPPAQNNSDPGNKKLKKYIKNTIEAGRQGVVLQAIGDRAAVMRAFEKKYPEKKKEIEKAREEMETVARALNAGL